MIKVNRPSAPAFLLAQNGKWAKEIARAIIHFATPNAGSFSFGHYRDSKLKKELRKLFPICAYCESDYRAVTDGDVEHFRPKGRVQEKDPPSPGYYWLANDWDNLFLTCQHCNQNRRHILHGFDGLISAGKLDQFPLSDETQRLKNHTGSVSNEDKFRLLINPCKEKPSDHFEYERTEGVIRGISPMGVKSIEVYALQRHYLVKERKKVLLLLFKQMERVKREMVRLDSDNTLEQKAIFTEEFNALTKFGQFGHRYTGMCRFFIKKFLTVTE